MFQNSITYLQINSSNDIDKQNRTNFTCHVVKSSLSLVAILILIRKCTLRFGILVHWGSITYSTSVARLKLVLAGHCTLDNFQKTLSRPTMKYRKFTSGKWFILNHKKVHVLLVIDIHCACGHICYKQFE